MRLTPLALFALIALPGCHGSDVQPLNSDAFYRRQQIVPGYSAGPRSTIGPVDESGRVDPIARKTSENDTVNGVSSVSDSEPPPRLPARPLVLAPLPMPATQPLTTRPTTLPTGQYMIVGSVVADVDGTPIFANHVLSVIDKALAARARDLNEAALAGKTVSAEAAEANERAFRVFAIDQIRKEVETEVRNELVYRAAERSLSESDRALAYKLTGKWKQDEINNAGGSIELARRRAMADGSDFDELADEKHRWYMTRVYYEKKVIPLIVVTADMMREFYDHNQAKLFTEKSGVKFRMIKVDSKQVGDRARAETTAKEWQAKLAAGEDFAAFAHDNNKEPYLRNHDGLPMEGMIDRGAFAIKPVEDAAWALQPGQVSGVITVGDVFYIIKLEAKTVGRVKPFDSEEVQDQITGTLRSEQFRVLREREEDKLKLNAIVRSDDRAITLAVDMAMQRYQQWKSN